MALTNKMYSYMRILDIFKIQQDQNKSSHTAQNFII